MKYFLNNFKVYILATLFAVIISVALLYPALPKLNSSFIGDGGDNYEFASYMMLFKKNITDGNFPFGFTNYWRYPVGFDFARSFDSHIAVTLGGALSFFVSSPLYYNITVIILMALNGLFSFAFFRYLTGSKSLGFLGMLMYGFSFYTLAKAESHLNLLFVGGFPLLGYAVLRIVKEPKINLIKLFLFFFSLLLIALGSKEYFLLAIVFLIIYFAITIIFYKNTALLILSKLRTSYKLVLGSIIVFTASLVAVFLPYINAIIHGQFYLTGREDTLFVTTPAIVDFIIPNRYLNLLSSVFKSDSRISIESLVFVGWVELLIFVLFFLNRKIKTRFKLFILTSFLIPFTLALGYGKQDLFPLLPYHFLKNILLFKVFAETDRYFIVFYLIMSAAVVIMLNYLKANKRIFTVVFVLITLLILLERVPLKIMTVPTLYGNYTKIVREQPGIAVLDLPVNIFYANYDLLSFYYKKAVVNGYFHWASDGPREKSFILNKSGVFTRYTCSGMDYLQTKPMDYAYEASLDSQMISLLKANGIQTLVIHKDDKFWYPECKNVRERLNRLISLDFIPLETTSPTVEKQLNSLYWDGQPSFNFYVPYDGKVYLDGIYTASINTEKLDILVDGKPLSGYSWSANYDHSLELSPKYSIAVKVKAGSKITFSSQVQASNTYFSLWYRYVADNNSPKIAYPQTFRKIFEDNAAIVYQLK